MNRHSLFICRILAVLSFILGGCEEEQPAADETRPVAGFAELIDAYEAGKSFSEAVHSADGCLIRFTDGSSVSVPRTSFIVHDCTQTYAQEVTVAGGWWKVGEINLPIRADSSLSRKDSEPVYVYYDTRTLYMYLSNREVLEFTSPAAEQEKEHAKRQNIPVVRINTAGKAPILDKKNYVDGTISISDPEKLYSDVGEFKADMGIRGRGNSTWEWEKKPWKVKLDSKASLLGMPADEEWALLANYADRTLMRNIVAMRLSEICGFSWTPRMRSVEVYLNDEYQGVYTLCEHKKVSKDRVNIDVVGEGDNGGEAVTGAYYLEMEENQDETTCWWTAMGVPMMFSDPEVPTSEQYSYMTGYIDDFEKALRGPGSADPDVGYAAYIDVKSFIDYYIVQELTKNVDGNLRKSSFITKEQGKKMEMYHLWDFDLTLGNCGYFNGSVGNGPENFWVKDYSSDSTYGGGWFWHLFKDPAFVKAVQTRWNELMPQLETIPQFIDDQAFALDKAQIRNFERWNIRNSVDWVKMPSRGSYEAEVRYLKEFYSKRLEWLDTAINDL